MENKLYCTKCGHELEENTKFCSECGQEIELLETPSKKRGRKKKVEEQVIEEQPVLEDTKVTEPNIETPSIEDKLLQKEKELKKEKRKRILYPIISCLVTFTLCVSVFSLFYEYYLKNLVIETTKKEVTITDTGISEAVEKVYDSVVVVESYQNNKLYSTGTGFVYKTKANTAYILTNHHVIESADKVKVVFTNDEKETVEIVGSDSYSDVAVLSVSKDKIISVAEIGSSEALKVGDTSFAVGAPLDSSTYAWTVTRGVISGKNRTVEVTDSSGYSSTIMEVLQTDTAINSGNSGGPLCNSNGEVIGITNMKLASSTVEGMGFAIPIETAVKHGDTLITGKKISYPYIGVTIYDARESYYSNEVLGVYIESVEENGPADKAGMKKGDKILKVEDTEIKNTTYFKHELYKHSVGDKIKIVVERKGTERTLIVTLGSQNLNT